MASRTFISVGVDEALVRNHLFAPDDSSHDSTVTQMKFRISGMREMGQNKCMTYCNTSYEVDANSVENFARATACYDQRQKIFR